MLTVSRQSPGLEPDGIVKPPFFGIQFDQDSRTRETLMALVTEKLPGTQVQTYEHAEVLCVYLGEYADSEKHPWSTWSASDFLEKLGEPHGLQVMIWPDTMFPWARLLRVDRELNAAEHKGLRRLLGITAKKLAAADHATVGIVYRLSMAVGVAFPEECDIIALLETETQ